MQVPAWGPLNGFNKRKAAFDEAGGVSSSTLHDVHRTACTLMSRASVTKEHAERVLGRQLQGVERVYDRHAYLTEKGATIARLADLIDRMIAGTANRNVLTLLSERDRNFQLE